MASSDRTIGLDRLNRSALRRTRSACPPQSSFRCNRINGGRSRRSPLHHDRSSQGATHAWIEAAAAGPGLGRFRSHDQSTGRRPTHPHRDRPRLRGRSANARGIQGHRGQSPQRRRTRSPVGLSSPARRGNECYRGLVHVSASGRRSNSSSSNSNNKPARTAYFRPCSTFHLFPSLSQSSIQS